MSPISFDYIRKLVFAHSSIVVDQGKEVLTESRLAPIARSEGYPSIDDLVRKLNGSPFGGMHRKVVEAMTTNETYFLRDIHPFDALSKIIVPEIVARRGRVTPVNIWSAASSAGQEAYSILMTLSENHPDLFPRVRVYATDLASEMVARTRAGKYTHLEVNRGLPASLLVKYFERVDADWVVRSDIRKHVDAAQLNLNGPWPTFPKFDVVFLRNVLIYFDVPTKKSILGRVKGVLAPGGYLALGSAETTMNLDDDYERVQLGKASFYRIRK